MRIRTFAVLAALLGTNGFVFAGTATTSPDAPLEADIITADGTGTSFTRIFADPADHPLGNTNNLRGNAFRISEPGSYQIEAVTIHKDTEEAFVDADLAVWLYEGTVEQWALGDGNADGDLFNGTGITNVLADGELFALDGMTLVDESFLTLTFETPLEVDGDSDFGFAIRYLPSRATVDAGQELNYVQFHETGGAGDFGLGQLRGQPQQVRTDRRLNYSILGKSLGGGNLPCDFVNAGDGCDISDLDALYAGTDGAPEFNQASLDQWLVDASSEDNLAKGNSTDTYVVGDVDLDGSVNSTDLGLLLNNFGGTSNLRWGNGNLTTGDTVDSTDLGLLLNNFGFDSPAPASAVAVPEPDSLALLLLALLFCARSKKRVG